MLACAKMDVDGITGVWLCMNDVLIRFVVRERTKAGFAEAAEATKTAGLKAKAMGELELLKRKLQGIKQEFGVEAFPYFEQDRTTVFTIYERYKVRADEVTNKIREKEREIQRFNDKGNDDSSFEPLFDDNKDKSAPSGGSNFQI